MSTIGKNIKKIRTVKKLSQASFAELFNLARPSVGAYEEGRAEPKIETIIQMANYFGISVDSLLTKELTINELYKFDLHAKELINQPSPNKSPEKAHENIRSLFIPAAKQIEYLVQLNNKDFLSSLPRVLIPGFESDNIRAFEMTTGEMYDNFRGINNEDIVIGKKLNNVDARKFKRDNVYIFVLPDELMIRRLDAAGDKLVVKADNPGFSSKEIDTAEILEVWEVIGFFSKNIKPPSVLSDRVMLLENAMEKLATRLRKLEKRN